MIARSKLVLAEDCADPSGFLGMDSVLGERVKLFKLRSAEHAPSIDASALKATAYELIRFARRPAKAPYSSLAAHCAILLRLCVLDQHLVFGGTHMQRVLAGRSWAIRSDRGKCVLSATTSDRRSPILCPIPHGFLDVIPMPRILADFGGLMRVSGIGAGGALLAANRQKVFIVAEISQPKRSQPVKKGALNS